MNNYDLITGEYLRNSSPKFLKMARDAKPYVEAFCYTYDVKLMEVGISNESEDPEKVELFYAFDNNTGGHNLTSIIGSLLDEHVNLMEL